MANRTAPRQRRRFYERHLRGETYQDIAMDEKVSKECVRYWCRRQRDGGSCHTNYQRTPSGLLSRFHPLVRYAVLRMRFEHPRWGPNRIREKLKKRPSLKGLSLPSESSIGRYLHQWSRFRRPPKGKTQRVRPNEPTFVHQRWQMDFKLDIVLSDGTLVSLYTVRDPVGEACIGAVIFPSGKKKKRVTRPTLENARSVLRSCFSHWGTLPDEIQTDGESALVNQPEGSFPNAFTLWLVGLGIKHVVIRSGKPTDNAEVERCHRTINDYAIVGNEDANVTQLQHILDRSVHELNFELPSRAEGCNGLAPVVAHPELLQPRRSFRPELELAIFELKKVDDYLATFTWERKVGKTGQITIGGSHQTYSVGRAYARRQILVRFDPTDRHFVFFDPDSPGQAQEIGRRPARNLDVADLTGLETWPVGPGPQQLRLPLPAFEGVSC